MIRASTLPYVPLTLTSVDHHRFVSTAYPYFLGLPPVQRISTSTSSIILDSFSLIE